MEMKVRRYNRSQLLKCCSTNGNCYNLIYPTFMLASNYLPPDVAAVCVVEVMQLSVVNNMVGCVSGCEEKSILLPLPLGRPTSILICISVIIHVYH